MGWGLTSEARATPRGRGAFSAFGAPWKVAKHSPKRATRETGRSAATDRQTSAWNEKPSPSELVNGPESGASVRLEGGAGALGLGAGGCRIAQVLGEGVRELLPR
jgi:hypothetical protein